LEPARKGFGAKPQFAESGDVPGPVAIRNFIFVYVGDAASRHLSAGFFCRLPATALPRLAASYTSVYWWLW